MVKADESILSPVPVCIETLARVRVGCLGQIRGPAHFTDSPHLGRVLFYPRETFYPKTMILETSQVWGVLEASPYARLL